jgi:hypothetical protein
MSVLEPVVEINQCGKKGIRTDRRICRVDLLVPWIGLPKGNPPIADRDDCKQFLDRNYFARSHFDGFTTETYMNPSWSFAESDIML